MKCQAIERLVTNFGLLIDKTFWFGLIFPFLFKQLNLQQLWKTCQLLKKNRQHTAVFVPQTHPAFVYKVMNAVGLFRVTAANVDQAMGLYRDWMDCNNNQDIWLSWSISHRIPWEMQSYVHKTHADWLGKRPQILERTQSWISIWQPG